MVECLQTNVYHDSGGDPTGSNNITEMGANTQPGWTTAAVPTYPRGNCQLKTPYRDGTTHVIFEPLDFIARLAALVPKRRVNLTCCVGDTGQTG